MRKEEDVQHVTKHMGNQLRAFIQDWREKKLSAGETISRKGRLTNNYVNVQGLIQAKNDSHYRMT